MDNNETINSRNLEETKVLDIKVYELDLSIRACNVLRRNGYEMVRDLLKFSNKEEILSLKSFSIGCGEEVANKLKALELPENIWYEFII